MPTGEIYKNLRGQKLAEQAVACSEVFRQHAMHHISTPSAGIDVSVEGLKAGVDEETLLLSINLRKWPS